MITSWVEPIMEYNEVRRKCMFDLEKNRGINERKGLSNKETYEYLGVKLWHS